MVSTGLREFNHELLILDPDGVGLDRLGRGAPPRCSRCQIELGTVPRAGHDILHDPALLERSTDVRAGGIYGVQGGSEVEHRDGATLYRHPDGVTWRGWWRVIDDMRRSHGAIHASVIVPLP